MRSRGPETWKCAFRDDRSWDWRLTDPWDHRDSTMSRVFALYVADSDSTQTYCLVPWALPWMNMSADQGVTPKHWLGKKKTGPKLKGREFISCSKNILWNPPGGKPYLRNEWASRKSEVWIWACLCRQQRSCNNTFSFPMWMTLSMSLIRPDSEL